MTARPVRAVTARERFPLRRRNIIRRRRKWAQIREASIAARTTDVDRLEDKPALKGAGQRFHGVSMASTSAQLTLLVCERVYSS